MRSCLLFLLSAGALFAQVTASQLPEPRWQPLDNNGKPVANGKICTYLSGGFSPAPTYTDNTGNVQNSNPIILDSAGRANIWFGTTQAYRVVFQKPGDNNCPGTGASIWTQDGVQDSSGVLKSQLAAASGASLIGFQQVNGTATTVEAALRNCPFDVQYATLAIAVANIPSYGCLNVVGTWTIASTIPVTQSHITIYGQPGSLFNAGATNLAHGIFNVTGSDVTITGCTFDGQYSQHGYVSTFGGIYTFDADRFTATWNTFRNMSGWAVFLDDHSTDDHLAHNQYQNIGIIGSIRGAGTGGGILAHNGDNLTIEYETCRVMSSDNCIHLFAGAIAAGSAHSNWSIDHVYVQDFSALAIEASTTRARGGKFTNNHAEISRSGNTAFSITQVGAGGASTAPEEALIVSGNSVHEDGINANPITGLFNGGYCYELFSNHVIVTGNQCAGPWDVGIVLTGSASVSDNDITGTRIGISQNGTDATYAGSSWNIVNNRFYNIGQWTIVGGPENFLVDNNSDYRTPGYFSADGTGNFATHIFGNLSNTNSSTASGGGAAVFSNNSITIAPVVSVPAGFKVAAFNGNNNQYTGYLFTNNTMFNQNTFQFGQAFITGNGVNFYGSSIYSNKWVGLLHIGDLAFNSSFPIYYGGNLSLAGNTGLSPVTDFTIGPYFPNINSINAGSAPTLTLSGGAGVGATGTIAGTPYQGVVYVTTAGTPNALQFVFQLAPAAGSFTVAPYCSLTPANNSTTAVTSAASVQVSFDSNAAYRTTTLQSFVAGSTALASGAVFGWVYHCPWTQQ